MTDAFRGGCSPRQDKCKASCLHRQLIQDYRIERHRQEMVEESETLGYATELKMRREAGLRPITFREWITGLKRQDDPDDYQGGGEEDFAGAFEAAGW